MHIHGVAQVGSCVLARGLCWASKVICACAGGSQRASGGRVGRKTHTCFVLLWSCVIWGHQSAHCSCQLLVSQFHSRCRSLVEQVCNHEMLLILEHWLLFNQNSEVVLNTSFHLRGGVLLCLGNGRRGGLGGLMVPPCLHDIAGERWASQAGTPPPQGSACLSQSLIQMTSTDPNLNHRLFPLQIVHA